MDLIWRSLDSLVLFIGRARLLLYRPRRFYKKLMSAVGIEFHCVK